MEVLFKPDHSKRCIIEFQSFVDNEKRFIVKELVVMDLQTNVVNHFLLKPPYSFKKLSYIAKKTNKWLMNNFHYIAWSEGFVNYKELDNIMYHYCQQYETIYTTGFKKKQWIEQYTTNKVFNYLVSKNYFVNVGDGFCNSVNNYKHKTSNCALLKAFKVLSSMGNDGGGDGIKQEDVNTYHELFSNTAPANIGSETPNNNGI